MKYDFRSIDWIAILQSRVVWGSIVAIVASIGAITGHTVNAEQQSQMVNDLANGAQAIAVIAGIFTLHARVTAQATDATTILPKKTLPPTT